jgi:hypothetical protein
MVGGLSGKGGDCECLVEKHVKGGYWQRRPIIVVYRGLAFSSDDVGALDGEPEAFGWRRTGGAAAARVSESDPGGSRGLLVSPPNAQVVH